MSRNTRLSLSFLHAKQQQERTRWATLHEPRVLNILATELVSATTIAG